MMSTNSPNTMILANLIADRMQQWPDRDVLTFVTVDSAGGLNEEQRTYTQLWQNGQQIASALDKEGM
ncbi:MAG: hypothetical protein ACI9BW_003828, partial [Gammaproteobacteria bacterium]